MSTTGRLDALDRAGLTMPASDLDPEFAGRLIGLRLLVTARMLGILVAVAAGALAQDRWAGFWVLAGGMVAGQAVVTAVAFSSRWERATGDVLPLLGLLALGGLVAASGGAQSPVTMVVVAFPAVGAFVLGRRRVLLSGALLLAAVTAAALPDVLQDEPLSGRGFVTTVAALVLAVAIGVAIATGRSVLRERAADLYRVHRQLLVDRLSAVATERRRISADLGAGALQLLLAARQDLEELRRGPPDPQELVRCRRTLLDAGDRLRATIVELRRPRATRTTDAVTTRDDRLAVRMLAVLRVTAGPPLATAALLGEPGRTATIAVVALLVVMGTVQAVALVWSFSERWQRLPTVALAAFDMAALAVLIALTGGAQSPVCVPAALLPLTFLLVGPPRTQLAIVGVLVTGVAASGIPDVLQGEPRAGTALAVALLTLGWTAVVAQLASIGRTRLELRTADLESARRQLLDESVAAQDAERSAVARALHDEALQLVFAAAQELERAPTDGEDPVALALSHTTAAVAGLREGADVLHPSALEHGGLGPALREIAERAARRGGAATVVEVEDVDERHEELVVGLTRELVTNAAKHARARTVTVEVRADGDGARLSVRDDGVGMLEDRPREALEKGHVGLASCREQVEAVGGELHLRSAPDAGTEVRVHLP